ncbi:uncharacterized protein L201_007999 [Kwoniella dendrophila CBS 6074]|uniref:Uncharacterized protein n=1 Tax=Kwoniella dendrophila CBS 6074 TaxID=1295534 RepID=A0AAX4K860_9TREE
MLRRIRAKLQPTLLRPPISTTSFRLSSSAALAQTRELEDEHHAPYGLEYGAGPSRIPYQPRRNSVYSSRNPIQSHNSSPLVTARSLRDVLGKLPPGSYAQPQVFLKTIFNQPHIWTSPKNITYTQDLGSISRLELHTILHHLIRKKRGNLAAAIVSDVLSASSRNKRRNLLAIRTLTSLFKDRSIFNMLKAGSHNKTPIPPNLTPTIEEQMTLPPSRDLAILLHIMDSLQDVRYQRPYVLYALVIKQCVDEHLFDLAAKIYVGLVEEWVTEGRVAHGANPDDFHPGGGPPRDGLGKKQLLSKLLGHWWTGVRTWRLPGEILSPHDRLDLWHPKHLSLGEKMKNFPLPIATSPPSLVPQPKTMLLNTIINSLKLNPNQCSPREFSSSMRALAILANTVLSRTLPIIGLGRLLAAFKSTSSKPPVYPENITEIPLKDEWAYTSFTQIHVTLMSLLFAPPISSHSMQLIAENHDHNSQGDLDGEQVAALPSTVNTYMLPPLSLKSSTILLQYAFQSLRRPFLLTRLLDYMKKVFNMGGANPSAFNSILKGSSALSLNAIASKADTSIFGEQQHTRPSHATSRVPDSRYFSSAKRVELQQSAEYKRQEEELLHTVKTEFELGISPLPNEQSLINLIKHLTVTSQFGRLEGLVYTLEPYLEFSKKMTNEEVENMLENKGLEPGLSGRPRSQLLSPQVYLALLRGLQKSGSTGLAQRVFNLALYRERVKIDDYLKGKDNSTYIPSALKFPLEGYRIMIEVWGNETKHFKQGRSNEKELPLGWSLPKEYINLPRSVAAGYMSLVTHHLAKKSFSLNEFNKEYYQSLIKACRFRWKLNEDKQIFRGFRGELKSLCLDLKSSNLEIPDIIRIKLIGGSINDIIQKDSNSEFKWRNENRQKQYQNKLKIETEEEKLLEKLLNGEKLDDVWMVDEKR